MNLHDVDRWFLELLVLVLGGLFMMVLGWSLRTTLKRFTEEVSKLEEIINKLFDRHHDHEQRISRLEGRANGG